MFNFYDTDNREFTEVYTAEELRDRVFNTIKYYFYARSFRYDIDSFSEKFQ